MEEQEKKIENYNEENNEKQTKNNALKVIIGVICAFLVCLELVLSYFFNIAFEYKIIVEIASVVLALLVVIGVVKPKTTNSGDVAEIKKEIEQSINEKIKDIKNKK